MPILKTRTGEGWANVTDAFPTRICGVSLNDDDTALLQAIATKTVNTVSHSTFTLIGSYAFCSCPALQAASFPACSFIGTGAFANCQSLTSLYLLGAFVPALEAEAFEATPLADGTGSIFVRASLLTAWQASAAWAPYAARLVGLTDAEIADLT